jgi:20S proteasome alpha/beta subunit
MTLVLASSCVDGVVVVADRAFMDLHTLETIKYDEKLSGVIRNVIFGYAGSVDIYHIFVRYVVGDLVMLRDDPARYTYQNMIPKFGMIMDKIRKSTNPFLLDVIVARQFPKNGKSDLFLVKANGSQHHISGWKAVGNGELIANKIVSSFWNNEIIMRNFAR